MKKYGRSIVLAFCVLGLAASLIMNVVLLRKTTALRLLDVTDVGLAPLLGAEITEMYIDEDNNPDFRGTFQDQEVAEQLKALLPPSGAQVVVDVSERPFHLVAEKSSHGYALLR